MPKSLQEIENIPHADASDKEIEELLQKLRVFKEDEFANLLHQCHNVIRNREHKDPTAAFDEIAKILFVKVLIERRLKAGRARRNIFSVEFLDEQASIYSDPIDGLFDQTKKEYRADHIFQNDERINLRPATVKEIVRLLERYNLSDTSEDIKGIAFERFLGRTFRGEIGQFFTPRSIVEFMVMMVNPKEGEIICDPASGSGGFLIRFFELIREQIMSDIDKEYKMYRDEIENKDLSEEEQARLLTEKYNKLQRSVDPHIKNSRLWKLANKYIFGCDANERMARTSKMNMIMHGDGHGGVHHHNGFINVNGIFEGRFDIVLTNPPFGANVEATDVISASDLNVSEEEEGYYLSEYGNVYSTAINRVRNNLERPILSLFDLKIGNKTKTEILFIERCINLLKPTGRLGIVLPEGIFNNPSLARVREFVEDRAYIRAVVSLPEDTFVSTGTTVKASLLFLQKFSETEQTTYNAEMETAITEILASQRHEREQLETVLSERIKLTDFFPSDAENPSLEVRVEAERLFVQYKVELDGQKKEAIKRLKELDEELKTRSRSLLKKRFSYKVFMYEAGRVGITATGEEDLNELFPNERQTQDNKTVVEQYQDFLTSTELIPHFCERRLSSSSFLKAFHVNFEELARWDPGSFCFIDWHWSESVMKPIGSLLSPRKEKVDRSDYQFSQLQPITIHFNGSIDKRNVEPGREYRMELFHAYPGDLVVSKIDLKNGAVGIVPFGWENVVVTNHFAVYKIDTSQVIPEYLHRIIQQKDFKEYLWRHKVGAEGRKEVKLDFFESIRIPVPDMNIQLEILSYKKRLLEELEILREKLTQADADIEQMILGAKGNM